MDERECISCGETKDLKIHFGLEGPKHNQCRRHTCMRCVRIWNKLPKEERDRIKLEKLLVIQGRTEKRCPTCDEIKPRTEFFKCKSKADGLASECKICDNKRSYTIKSKYKYTQYHTNDITCHECGKTKPVIMFNKNRHHKTGYHYVCRECDINQKRFAATGLDHRRRTLLSRIQTKCNRYSIPFDLTIDDIIIPEVCPVLHIPLQFGRREDKNRDFQPSLDRIIPSLGYVKGNVIVVSFRANRIKNDSTVDELFLIAKFYKDLLTK